MKRALLVAFVIAAAGAPAVAQMGAPPASALGEPREMPELKVGTVTVRVVAGDPARPVDGFDVKLIVDGATKIARTDPQGRASFAGLKVGASVKATIETDQGEQSSKEFEVPDQTGVAVMLSTLPWQQGRPEPLKMARIPRGESDDPPGQVTVVVRYNDHDAKDPYGGVPVTLVAYAADDRVAAKTVPTDGGGRAVFSGLDTSGRTAYYALTTLPRGDGHDRLQSNPILPPPEVGMRVMLSGEKLGSPEPALDDLRSIVNVPQPKLPPGQIRVVFGNVDPKQTKAKVDLIDIATGEVIKSADAGHARPIPGSVTGAVAEPVPDPLIPVGSLKVHVAFDVDPPVGIPSTKVKVRAVTAAAPPAAPAAPGFAKTAVTDEDGFVTIPGAPVGVPLEIVIDVQGTPLVSKPFELPADRGATVEARTRFEWLANTEAIFDAVPDGPGAYLVEAEHEGETYRSMPFQMVPDRGVVIPVKLGGPRISATFQLTGIVDDEYLGVQGQFAIINSAWAPWVGPAGGLRLPAPSGATGLGVQDQDKSWVAADGDSFRLLRPVPPSVAFFTGGFSMKSDNGEIHWDWALPLGATQASLDIRLHGAAMRVELPPGAKGRSLKDKGFTWFTIRPIDIPRDRRMIFDIRGMPQRPAWQFIAKLVVGVSAILLIGAGLAFALWLKPGRSTGAPSIEEQKRRRRRIDELLDQVAALDRQGAADPAQRAVLVGELEALYKREERAA